jgi:hypothetical protein
MNHALPGSSDEDGASRSEDRLVGGSRSALDRGELREPEALGRVLPDLRPLDVGVGEADGLDDMDALVPGAVAAGHLAVHLGDSAAEGGVTVLLVHVDIIRAGQVLQHDAVVPEGAGLALEDLRDGDDLALALADLVLALHLVPEPGAGEDGILGEHSNPVARRVGIVLRRGLPADNPVLTDLQNQLKREFPRVDRLGLTRLLTVLRMEGH